MNRDQLATQFLCAFIASKSGCFSLSIIGDFDIKQAYKLADRQIALSKPDSLEITEADKELMDAMRKGKVEYPTKRVPYKSVDEEFERILTEIKGEEVE